MSGKREVTPATPLRNRLLLGCFGVSLAVLVLLGAEGLLRLIGPDVREGDPFVGFAPGVTLFQEEGDYFVTRQSKLGFFNPQKFSVKKASGTQRIFVLGGSTVFGRPYDHRTAFPAYLSGILNQLCSGTYEVINAGGISYASYRLKLLMEELVTYEPDIFIIYTGHNEFLEERTYPELKDANADLMSLRGAVQSLRLARLFRPSESGEGKAQLAGEVQAKLDVWQGLDSYTRDKQLEAGVIQHFRYNLNYMVDKAREHGSRVILVTPTANLTDFSPFKSENAAELSTAQQTQFADAMNLGQKLALAGDLKGAQEKYAEAVHLDPAHAMAHYHLATTYRQLGERQLALTHFGKAVEEDICPLRAKAAFVGIVREVSKEKDIPLFDFQQDLAERFDQTNEYGPGNAQFLDHVHPRPEMHFHIGRSLAKLVDTSPWEDDPVLSATKAHTIFEAMNEKLDPSYHGMRDLNLAKVLGWAGKLAEAKEALDRAALVLPDNHEVFFNKGLIYEKLAQNQDAILAYSRAVDLNPKDALSLLNLGRIHLKLGQYESALAFLDQSASMKPDTKDTQFARAEALLGLGETTKASAAITRLEQIDPHHTGLDVLRAKSQLAQGQYIAAIAFFQGRLNEADPSTFYDLGVAQAKAEDWEKARKNLVRCLDLSPENDLAWVNLGRVQREVGANADAELSFEKAIEHNPANGDAWFALADMAVKRRDLPAAAHLFSKAAQLDPENIDVANNQGFVFGQMGRWSDAVQAFSRAVKLDPNSGKAHYNLAQAYVMSGAPKQGAQHIKQAQALGQKVNPALLRQLEPYMRENP